jgi:hypothetical protein
MLLSCDTRYGDTDRDRGLVVEDLAATGHKESLGVFCLHTLDGFIEQRYALTELFTLDKCTI